MTGPIVATEAGVRIAVHVQPRAAATAVAGLHGDAIKLRIAAPPVDGAANEAIVAFVAETLGVPRRAVAITAGAAGRRKTVTVAGVTVAQASRLLR